MNIGYFNLFLTERRIYQCKVKDSNSHNSRNNVFFSFCNEFVGRKKEADARRRNRERGTRMV